MNIIIDNKIITEPVVNILQQLRKESNYQYFEQIQDKGDYYEIFVETDSDFASKDSATKEFFKEDNGATGATISKCDITIQIWKCGLIKQMFIDEEWSGKIKIYSGTAKAQSKVVYSYTDEDCNDDSKTEAIWRAL